MRHLEKDTAEALAEVSIRRGHVHQLELELSAVQIRLTKARQGLDSAEETWHNVRHRHLIEFLTELNGSKP